MTAAGWIVVGVTVWIGAGFIVWASFHVKANRDTTEQRQYRRFRNAMDGGRKAR